DVGDVLDEGAVRPDDEHALSAQSPSVCEQEPRRAMEADRRLPRSRSALDYEDASGFVRDQPVLVGLDRLYDVPHPLVAAALELLEQEIAQRPRLVADRPAACLGGDVEEV